MASQDTTTAWPRHGQEAYDTAGLCAERAARALEGLTARGECRDTRIVSWLRAAFVLQ